MSYFGWFFIVALVALALVNSYGSKEKNEFNRHEK